MTKQELVVKGGINHDFESCDKCKYRELEPEVCRLMGCIHAWSVMRDCYKEEEAIQVLNMVEAHGSLVKEAKEMAIKALEQEPILDKIRAEIEQITDTMGVSYNQYVSKIDVLQIIDKYLEPKAESEDKE